MSFSRTPEGISATPHFQKGFDAHLVVEGEVGSPDTLFWKRVINEFRPTAKIKIERAGNRDAVLRILHSSNFDKFPILLCVDRDFDDLNDNVITHPRLLKTLGYSLENDILLCISDFSSVLELFISEVVTEDQSISLLDEIFEDVIEQILMPLCVIRLGVFNGLQIRGDEIHACLAFQDGVANFDEGSLFNLMQQKLINFDVKIEVSELILCCPKKNFRGHTLFNLFCHTLTDRISQEWVKVTLDQKQMARVLIQKMDFSCDDLFQHFNIIVNDAFKLLKR